MKWVKKWKIRYYVFRGVDDGHIEKTEHSRNDQNFLFTLLGETCATEACMHLIEQKEKTT